jgi:hypothetical protein
LGEDHLSEANKKMKEIFASILLLFFCSVCFSQEDLLRDEKGDLRNGLYKEKGKECNYSEGVRHGECKEYWGWNVLREIKVYEHGKIIETKYFDKKGKPYEETRRCTISTNKKKYHLGEEIKISYGFTNLTYLPIYTTEDCLFPCGGNYPDIVDGKGKHFNNIMESCVCGLGKQIELRPGETYYINKNLRLPNYTGVFTVFLPCELVPDRYGILSRSNKWEIEIVE